MWFLRRMLRIAWTDKVSNYQVLQRANTSRNLLKVIVSRQIRFVGHVMRKNQLEAVALTWMIEGKRARGRQRKTFMDWISTACGDKWNSNDIMKICKHRNEHLLIANVRVSHGTYVGSELLQNGKQERKLPLMGPHYTIKNDTIPDTNIVNRTR